MLSSISAVPFLALFGLILILAPPPSECIPLNRVKRAFSYIANETACKVDHIVYRDGDPVPTDDPCETCRCRPPGFSCVLRDCEVKSGCRSIRRIGECCPQYQCGCEHNGKYYHDGDRVPNAESPCYSCYCQGSSITCSLADCMFRFDCEPDYVAGECCPRYDHCPPDEFFVTVKSTEIPRLTTAFLANHSSTTPMTTTVAVELTTTTTTTTAPVTASSSISSTVVGASQNEENLNGTTSANAAVNSTALSVEEATLTTAVNASSISVDIAPQQPSDNITDTITTSLLLETVANITSLPSVATESASVVDYVTTEPPVIVNNRTRVPVSADVSSTSLETTENTLKIELSSELPDSTTIDLSIELTTSALTKSNLSDSFEPTTVSAIDEFNRAEFSETQKDLNITTKNVQFLETTTASSIMISATDRSLSNESVNVADDGNLPVTFATDASFLHENIISESTTMAINLSSLETTTPISNESRLHDLSREADDEIATDRAVTLLPASISDTTTSTEAPAFSETMINESATTVVTVGSVTDSLISDKTTTSPVIEPEIAVILDEDNQRRNETTEQTGTKLEATTEAPMVVTTGSVFAETEDITASTEVNFSITLSSEASPLPETTTGSPISS